MERFPGYTLVRTEDCPEQHGTLTVLTHDVSGATVLLTSWVSTVRVPCSTFWSTRCWQAAKNTR